MASAQRPNLASRYQALFISTSARSIPDSNTFDPKNRFQGVGIGAAPKIFGQATTLPSFLPYRRSRGRKETRVRSFALFQWLFGASVRRSLFDARPARPPQASLILTLHD